MVDLIYDEYDLGLDDNPFLDDDHRRRSLSMSGVLWAIIVVLFALWLIGWLAFHIGGIIHIILVVAVILLIINLLTARGARL